MRKATLWLVTASAALAAPGATQRTEPAEGPWLAAFSSERELRDFLRRHGATGRGEVMYDMSPAEMAAPPPPPAAPMAQGSIVTTGARAARNDITNVQEAGVDEGGIVKVRGDMLVILRRGRLFTVDVGGGRMRPVATIDAFPPGVSGQGDWYDEMLLSGDRVIVVGYSYARGGTEINRFRLGRDGSLRFEDAWHLKSNDYYSSRNYASRLIGDRLIFYTPLDLRWRRDPLEALPGMRRWDGRADRAFQPIAGPRDIFIAPALKRSDEADVTTLHTVTSCDLAAAALRCSATGVLGPHSRTFYVSGGAVYLWTASPAWRARGTNPAASALYRLPLDRSRPAAIMTRGAPVDQFSFREDPAEGVVNVLLRTEGGGDAMFRPESSEGEVALLRLPLRELGDGSREAPRARYRPLPWPGGESWTFRNRFVGDHVLYGNDSEGRGRRGWGGSDAAGARLIVAPVRGGEPAEFGLAHGVGRIEALGADALVVGSEAADLGFTAVELGGRRAPRLGDRYTLPAAQEGETRSHAFFFSPDARSPDGASGTLGLPVARPVEPALHRFFGSAAAMLFLRRDARRFAFAGELEARTRGVTDDDCRASCVDWYGHARPIFLGDRVFALLGYELVEGELRRGTIREIGRTDFAPRRNWRDRK